MSKSNKPNGMIPGVGYIRMSGDQQEIPRLWLGRLCRGWTVSWTASHRAILSG